MTILYVGSDITAASYGGAPKRNAHMLMAVKIRRDGKGEVLEPFLYAVLTSNECGSMHSADILDTLCTDALSPCSGRIHIHERVCLSNVSKEKKLFTLMGLSSLTQFHKSC